MDKRRYEASDSNFLLKKHPAKELKEDNSSWLISFVDLISILLIFSFTLFIAMPKGSDHREMAKNPSKGAPLLFNIAHASTNEDLAPLYLNDVSGTHMTDTGERVISRHSVYFNPDETSLRASSVSNLGNIASLSKKNRFSKIIITTNKHENPDTTIKRANNIVDYFTLICKIERDKIFLQSLTEKDLQKKYSGELLEKNSVDVKLIKDFWNF